MQVTVSTRACLVHQNDASHIVLRALLY